MHTLQLTIAQAAVRSLDQLGVKPPKAVADAIAVRDAALSFDADTFDAETLHTAKPSDVQGILDAAALTVAHRTAIDSLRSEIDRVTARRLIGAVNSNTDAILASVGDKFDALAEQFANLVDRLPENFDDPAALVAAGPDAVAAFSDAQRLAADLEPFIGLRNSLPAADIAGMLGKATTFAEVPDQAIAAQVAAAQPGPLGLFGSILQETGVRLRWWRSRAEQQNHINALPEGRKTVKIVGLGGIYEKAS